MEDQKKKSPIAAISILVLVLVVAYFGYLKYGRSQSSLEEGATTTQDDISQNAATTTLWASPTGYKDGTYTQIGNYTSPGGAEQIQVSLTLKDNVVTDLNVVSIAFRPETKRFQAKFISGIKDYVVGKKIDDIYVTRVSGSSRAPKGFMNALSKIKTQAAA